MEFFICEKCEGHGYIIERIITKLKNELKFAIRCDCCYGQGSLDWIDNVVGKSKNSAIRFPYFKVRGEENETETSDTLL